ncbi:uracil-xanthine permease family protein [Spirosoma validum]|uniref:Purine/pyrimidine permease n=1 Tax=Spirosoma validum TaxID=2771355 RepID=A0A927B3A6_9BACT|nr:solute carrier family 23 protein [Spirosoma validum]MBD2754452.1 purine/pyrimidine permease [Spirosoma validum]
MSELVNAQPTRLVYGLEDQVPLMPALLVSLQQVGAMVVGTITPALILSGILHFSQSETAYLVSMALVASALGTFLQTMRFGFVGSGLLSITGTSFAFLAPLIQAGLAGGLPLMVGMSLAATPVQLILAPFLPKLKRVFTPLVSGIVVLLIGLSLIPTGMRSIAKLPMEGAPAWSGGLVALAVVTVMIIAQSIGKAWARMAAVLVGVTTGYAICGFMGWLQSPAPSNGSWLTVPQLLPWGLDFNWELLFPFAFIYLVCVLEAMGDITATSQLSGLPTSGPAHWTRIRGGILADGLTCIFSTLIGGFPSATYAQNNGVIQMTGVAARRIGWVMAIILLCLGIFPPVGRWITVMPACVLGAMAIMLFGLVAVSGLRLMVSGGLSQRDALIAAMALGIGIGVPSQEEWLKTLPSVIQTFLESGVSAGGLVALLLNLLMPDWEKERLVKEEPSEMLENIKTISN